MNNPVYPTMLAIGIIHLKTTLMKIYYLQQDSIKQYNQLLSFSKDKNFSEQYIMDVAEYITKYLDIRYEGKSVDFNELCDKAEEIVNMQLMSIRLGAFMKRDNTMMPLEY